MWQGTSSNENVTVGAGKLYLEFFSPGTMNGLGLYRAGNVSELSVGAGDERVQVRDYQEAGKPFFLNISKYKNLVLNATMYEHHPRNLRALSQSLDSVLVQPATAVVAEAVPGMETAPILGGIIKTKKLGPITSFSIDFGGTPGVVNVDYVVLDASIGLYKVTDTTILTGTVTISYTPTAYTSSTGPTVNQLAVVDNLEGRLLWVGNPTHGPRTMIEIWKVSFTPNGVRQLISEDAITLPLQATVLADSDNHPGNPYGQETFLPDAA
jgi:hypothetical protein